MFIKLIKFIISLGVVLILAGCGSKVDMVKEGILFEYSSSITVGNALEAWGNKFGTDLEWESFETDQKENIVQFSLDLNNISNDKAKVITIDDIKLDIIERCRDLYDPKGCVANCVLLLGYTTELFYKDLAKKRLIIQFSIGADGESFALRSVSTMYISSNGTETERIYSDAEISRIFEAMFSMVEPNTLNSFDLDSDSDEHKSYGKRIMDAFSSEEIQSLEQSKSEDL